MHIDKLLLVTDHETFVLGLAVVVEGMGTAYCFETGPKETKNDKLSII